METVVSEALPSLDGRRNAIIGYGSLINPAEVDDTFGSQDPLLVPFRLLEFKRVFNNRSMWRSPEGPESAVLNVEPASDRWCNVVLIVLRDDAHPESYDEREQGYHFEQLRPSQLEPYVDSHESLLEDLERIEVPIGDRVEAEIEPIPEYVDTCLEGVQFWDRELESERESGERASESETGHEPKNSFERDFVRTTELADGTPLESYLEAR